MNDKKWKVYVHINTINGKRYVGITSNDKPEYRWNHGRGYGENTHFRSAINKYGWDAFQHVILFEGLDEACAKAKEIELISEWHTNDSEFGYNMTIGGDGTCGYYPSAETRKKLSEARKKENLSEETLKRRSDGLRGRKFSDDHKRKIGIANSKAVDMFSLDDLYIRTFSSIADAETSTGISHSHISQCCTGQRRTSGGHKWRFAHTA